MSTQLRDTSAKSSAPPYRITLVGDEWHVTRPHATIDHAFRGLAEAEAFVRQDSEGKADFVEILAGSTYMVKSLRSSR